MEKLRSTQDHFVDMNLKETLEMAVRICDGRSSFNTLV